MLDWQVVAHSIAHSLRSWLQSRIPASSDKCLQDGLCSDSKDKLTGKNPTCAKNLKVNPQSGDARTVQLQVNLKTVWWSAQKDEEVFMQLKISLLIFLTIIRFFHLSRLFIQIFESLFCLEMVKTEKCLFIDIWQRYHLELMFTTVPQ